MSYYYRELKAGDTATKTALDDRELLSAVKPSNQTVNNSTVKVSDTALTLPLAANAVYHVSMIVIVFGPSGADWAQAWTVPASATGVQFIHGPELPTTNVRSTNIRANAGSLSTSLSYGTDGSENSAIREELFLTTAGTAGNLTLTWAQQVATVGATTVLAGSWMTAHRVV